MGGIKNTEMSQNFYVHSFNNNFQIYCNRWITIWVTNNFSIVFVNLYSWRSNSMVALPHKKRFKSLSVENRAWEISGCFIKTLLSHCTTFRIQWHPPLRYISTFVKTRSAVWKMRDPMLSSYFRTLTWYNVKRDTDDVNGWHAFRSCMHVHCL